LSRKKQTEPEPVLNEDGERFERALSERVATKIKSEREGKAKTILDGVKPYEPVS